MNKIFKVIWNRTTQSLVVTSELAKGVAKASSEVNVESKSSLGKVFKLSALSLLLLDVTSTAYAKFLRTLLAEGLFRLLPSVGEVQRTLMVLLL